MEHNLHVAGVIIVFLCFIVNGYSKLTVVNYVTLKTKFGTLIGTFENVNNVGNDEKGTSYFAFKGVPYAEPPVGEMRWKDTALREPFPEDVIVNATAEKAPCPQWINQNGTSVLLGDENCLHASIFIPVKTTEDSQNPLKIMVFFHGGGFIVNSNRNMLPVPLLAQKNAIIVMFNYRISIFGYLSTGTSMLPGNYAFLDQITLLKWIQLYGRDFGGDTNDVTIFGSSIGSVSIHYLLLSKLGSGLFHKAIMESGSAFCERSLVPNPLDISKKLGDILGCPASTNEHLLVRCLRSKSTVELMLAAKQLTRKWVLPSVLGPVIDKSSRPPGHQFLPDLPEKLSVHNKVPVIIGITSDEGLTAFVKLSKGFSLEQLHDLGYIQRVILPQLLDLIMRARKSVHGRQSFIEDLSKEVMLFYWKDFLKDPIATLVGILGDLWINACSRKTLEHLCLNGVPSVHAYIFSHHDAGISPSEIDKDVRTFHETGINHPILDNGAAHTEEILYMLAETDSQLQNKSPLAYFSRNQRMSEVLSRLWTTFPVFGSYGANQDFLFNGWPNWVPICYNSMNYNFCHPDYPFMEISLDNHRMFHNFRLREAEFWWRIHQDIQ